MPATDAFLESLKAEAEAERKRREFEAWLSKAEPPAQRLSPAEKAKQHLAEGMGSEQIDRGEGPGLGGTLGMVPRVWAGQLGQAVDVANLSGLAGPKGLTDSVARIAALQMNKEGIPVQVPPSSEELMRNAADRLVKKHPDPLGIPLGLSPYSGEGANWGESLIPGPIDLATLGAGGKLATAGKLAMPAFTGAISGVRNLEGQLMNTGEVDPLQLARATVVPAVGAAAGQAVAGPLPGIGQLNVPQQILAGGATDAAATLLMGGSLGEAAVNTVQGAAITAAGIARQQQVVRKQQIEYAKETRHPVVEHFDAMDQPSRTAAADGMTDHVIETFAQKTARDLEAGGFPPEAQHEAFKKTEKDLKNFRDLHRTPEDVRAKQQAEAAREQQTHAQNTQRLQNPDEFSLLHDKVTAKTVNVEVAEALMAQKAGSASEKQKAIVADYIRAHDAEVAAQREMQAQQQRAEQLALEARQRSQNATRNALIAIEADRQRQQLGEQNKAAKSLTKQQLPPHLQAMLPDSAIKAEPVPRESLVPKNNIPDLETLPILTLQEIARKLGIDDRTPRKWLVDDIRRKIDPKWFEPAPEPPAAKPVLIAEAEALAKRSAAKPATEAQPPEVLAAKEVAEVEAYRPAEQRGLEKAKGFVAEKIGFYRALDHIEKNVGPAGKQLVQDMRDIHSIAAPKTGERLFDFYDVVDKYKSHADRERLMRMASTKSSDEPPPDSKEAQDVDLIRSILDDQFSRAGAMGVEKTLEDGSKVRVHVTAEGDPIPQIPNKKVLEVLEILAEADAKRRAIRLEKAKAKVKEIADAFGTSKEEALIRLQKYREELMRPLNAYFEKARTIELPAALRDWDPEHVARRIEQNELTLAAYEKFGVNYGKLQQALDMFKAEDGSGNPTYQPALDFIRHELGADKPAAERYADVAGKVKAAETLLKLGPTTSIQNATQPFVALVDEPFFGELLPAYKKFFTAGRTARREIESRGGIAVRANKQKPWTIGWYIRGIRHTPIEKMNQLVTAFVGESSVSKDMRLLQTKLAIPPEPGMAGPGNVSLEKINAVIENALGPGDIKQTLSLAGRTPVDVAIRRMARKGVTANQIADAIMTGKPLTEEQINTATQRLNEDANFTSTVITRALTDANSPLLGVLKQFKPYAMGMTRRIIQVPLRELTKGNPKPAIKFLIATQAAGEVSSLMSSVVNGTDKSILAYLWHEGDDATAEGIATRMAWNWVKGAAIGFVADFTYGVGQWAGGPAVGSLVNIAETAANVGGHVVNAAQEVAHGETPTSLYQIPSSLDAAIQRETKWKSILEIPINALFWDSDNFLGDYKRIRSEIFGYKKKLEDKTWGEKVRSFGLDILQGTEKYRRGIDTDALGQIAVQLAVNDVDDAADLLYPIIKREVNLAKREGSDENKVYERIRLSMEGKSPLGMLTDETYEQFFSGMSDEKKRRLEAMERTFRMRYQDAIDIAKIRMAEAGGG